jgi:hypothetical protein
MNMLVRIQMSGRAACQFVKLIELAPHFGDGICILSIDNIV